jgi:SH3-like domain-containing protein
VVAPRHSGQVRRPVHPTVAVAAAPKAVAKPVPKPGVTAAAVVKPELPADVGPVTHLPLPRYVGLKSDEVNMRSGPGKRYPVLWTYKRRDLPMRVEREFDVWRLVEDMDGIKGWVQQNTLTGKRNFVVTGTEPRTLRAEADANSDAVAVLKPGVVGRVRSCDAGAAWCQVQVAGYQGWLERDSFWGTDSGEAVQP